MTRHWTHGLPAALLSIFLAGAAPAHAQTNQPPTAVVAALQTRNTFDVQFDGSGSADPDGSITAYSWDFGDGTGATGVRPAHSYAKAGKYSVKLTVTDNSPTPATRSATKIVTVDGPPVQKYSWKQFEGRLIIIFSAGGSTDAEGYVASHNWAYGDGTSGSGRDVSHPYSAPGDYNVTLTSTDNFGNTAATSFTVTVAGLPVNAAPVARASTAAVVNTLAIVFDGSTSSDTDGSISSYAWDFGDGTTGSDAKLTHTYGAPGQYAAKLTVRDNLGASNTAAVPVTVKAVNLPPVAWATASSSVDTLVAKLDGSASSDADGTIVDYAWDFGDNTSGSGVTASHTYAAPGEYQVRLKVTDNQGKANTYGLLLAVGTTATPRPWVTGYYAGWFWSNYQPQNIDMASMSHVVFGRVAPGGAGATMGGQPGQLMLAAGNAHAPNQLPPELTNKSAEDFLIERAHAVGTKAMLMLGGRKDGPGFMASTAAEVRSTFIDNLLDYLVAHRYDGVSVEWQENLDDVAAQGQLIAFVKELKAAAAQRTRYAAPNQALVVSFPTSWMNMNIDQVPAWKVELAGLVDQFNIMTYQMSFPHGGWTTWHFSPLGGQAGTHPTDVASTVQAYINAGIPSSRIGIGIGFYGSSYAPPVTGPGQTLSTQSSNDLEWSYANLVNGGFLAAGTYTWDPVAQMGYRSYKDGGFTGHAQYNTSTSGFLSYEDPASIAAKGKWVRNNQLGGTIIWTINYGSPDGLNNPLLNAVKQSFLLGGANTPPTARMSSTLEGTTDLQFAFDGEASTDADNRPVASHSWDFGDGATATGAKATHTFAAPGKYPVTLKVTDAQGVSDALVVVINAAYPPPPDTMPPLETIPPSTSDKPWVVGYYAGWFWTSTQDPRNVDYTAFTHLAFGRVAPGSGTLGGQPGEVILGAGTAHQAGLVEGKSAEDYLISRAHAAGAKAILMLGGVGDGNGFLRSTAPDVRSTFVKNLLDYLEQHDYDGIDVDWEDVLDTETAQFRVTALIADLRAGAKQRVRWQGDRQFVITFPGYALNMNYNKVDNWKVTLASIVDQYNLMTYGMGYNATGWVTTTFAPLEGQAPKHPMDISSSIQAYVDKGIPRKKLGLGIGFYGMCYQLPATEVNQPATAVDHYDVNWTYNKLYTRGFLSNGTYKWVDEAKMGYRSYPEGYSGGGGKTCGMVSYEDTDSIAAKGAWVRNPATAIGGAIIWVINYGTTNGVDNPLLDAVKRAFIQ